VLLVVILAASNSNWLPTVMGRAPANAGPVVGVAVAPAQPTHPMLVQIFNAQNRSWHYRWKTQLNVVTSPSAQLLDTLEVRTACGDCKTVGLAVQFNLVKQGLGTVTSTAHATNVTQCLFGTCITMGLVMQYTLIVDNVKAALPRMRRLLNSSIRLMRRMFPHHRVYVTDVLAGFNRLAQLIMPNAPAIVITTPATSSGAYASSDSPDLGVALTA
jgi:hypothetical protein